MKNVFFPVKFYSSLRKYLKWWQDALQKKKKFFSLFNTTNSDKCPKGRNYIGGLRNHCEIVYWKLSLYSLSVLGNNCNKTSFVGQILYWTKDIAEKKSSLLKPRVIGFIKWNLHSCVGLIPRNLP